MYLARPSRRWMVLGALGGSLVALVLIGLFVVYPKVGARAIRTKLTDKLGGKLGRDVTVGSVDVSLGHATVRDIAIRGPGDADMPMVHVDRVDLDFDTMRSLVGSVRLGEAKVDGVIITLRRDASGDNFQDVIQRVRGGDKSAEAADSAPGSKPTAITVSHVRLLADDAVTGTTALVADGDAVWTEAGLEAHARGLQINSIAAPKAELAKLDIDKRKGEPPQVSIDGGNITVLPQLALTGIGGTIHADPNNAGDYVIDVTGSYGGVPGKLWTAKGAYDSRKAIASVDLEAAKFQLDRLAPILQHSAVVDYQSTSIDTKVHLEVDRGGARFAGQFHLRGLNVGHPMIAEKEVHDLDLSGQIAGVYDRTTHRLDLTRGDFNTRNVPFSITGSVFRPPPQNVEDYIPFGLAYLDKKGPRLGPHGVQDLKLRLVVPSVDCQRALEVFPVEFTPYFAGYKLRGVFDTDVTLEVDWNDLDATILDGSVGIRKCKVVSEPDDSPKRLKDEFDHYVEVDKGDWHSFTVGESNPDFVKFEDISPYVVKSIMSTEDSGFYSHHGFIPSEFRTALITNLKAGNFVQGASSITMQLVKNVLLYREKTLARKFQELFLTWHLENTLSKDRIMEIYLNVIEYGPGLYGIGPAAHHYFGKQAKDLDPVEAAFFSSILPNPKERYKQYCAGTLTKWTNGKIERILQIMFKRDRLTQEEYDKALATPLLFNKDGSESEDECLRRANKAIKNARSTNPLKAKDSDKSSPKTAKKPKKHAHTD